MKRNKPFLSKQPIFNLVYLGLFLAIFCFPSKVAAQSPYTINVNIPPYDLTNSEHVLISTDDDWSQINNSDKRFFYVEPGSYKNGTIVNITADGTEDIKRYISLYNENDTHPAKLDVSDQANVQFVFIGASYWVVDRISSIGYSNGSSESFSYEFKEGSHNIVLNRMNLENFYEGIKILANPSAPYNEDITIQNSRIGSMSLAGIDDDNVGIKLVARDGRDASGTTKNIHILNNEFKNCNDGIMLQTYEDKSNPRVSFEGTIIDYNQIYTNEEVYTDGNGNITNDPGSLYALTENAIDLKGGSWNPDNPVIISNTIMWGFRECDVNGGGSGSHGNAITGHYGVKNLEYRNNIIFNCNRDLTFGAKVYRPYSAEDILIRDNIFYNIGFSPKDNPNYPRFYYESKNVIYEKNTLVDVNAKAYWFAFYGDEIGLTVSCNAIINSYQLRYINAISSSTIIANNSFYNTEAIPEYGTSYESAAEANMADTTFTVDLYTNNPYSITLPGVVTTDSSPHSSCSYTPPAGDLPEKAHTPSPGDTSKDIETATTISWEAGSNATSHNVYFGTSNPPTFIQNQATTSYKPKTLESGTIYYWQINEENRYGTTMGEVWSFTTIDSSDSVSELPQKDRIIGHWSFDGNADDISGNGLHGIPSNVNYSSDAKIGNASAEFSGSNTSPSYVSLPTEISEEDIKTISLWLNRTDNAPNGSTEAYLVRKKKLYIRLDNNGKIKLSAGTPSAFMPEAITTNNIWVHVVGVIGVSSVHIYVNGEELDDGGESDLTYTEEYFGIGGSESGDASFYGKIDDVIFWEVPLDANEVKEVMNYRDETLTIGKREMPNDLEFNTYPNPFSSLTNISFFVPEPGNVIINVYNSVGSRVDNLRNENYEAGRHGIAWSAIDASGNTLPNGIYHVHVRYKNMVGSSKIILITSQ